MEACLRSEHPVPILDGLSAQAELLSGDEAVAWAALDSGVRFASAYPGTPATEIQETLAEHASGKVRTVWSVNEKVAYESALAVGIAGQRAIVSMKQMGLNVAADAFMNSCPGGTNGGLVLAVADDPECHSSQNKQDTRVYRALSGTVLLEPADAQEAYDMTRMAFRVSEQFRLPVILRLATRTAHTCGRVRRRSPETHDNPVRWPKEPNRFFIVPTVSRRLFLRLAKLQDDLAKLVAEPPFSKRQDSHLGEGMRVGIICTGAGYGFACEFALEGSGILKVGGEPFPDKQLAEFVQAHDEIVVLEDGDPLLESRGRLLARAGQKIRGRLSGDLKPVGELQPEEVASLLAGTPRVQRSEIPGLPPRLPEICKPCGYHQVFAALKDIPGIATPSDIGCNSLGGLPPYCVMDGVWAMGSSLGIACGLAALGHKRIVAIIGDSTFFHAGIPALIEAVHERYTMTVLLLDNGAAAMTGGQGVAHRVAGPTQNAVNLGRLVEAIGVTRCTVFDPHKLGRDGIRKLVEDSFEQAGVKVLLYRSCCILHSPTYRSVAAARTIVTRATATTKAAPAPQQTVHVGW